jgi:three-Cys-motif partner protein
MIHTFGGNWTEEKLAVMRSYFGAYAQALKNQHFAKWYIDAFAGTGERKERKRSGRQERPLFGDDAKEVGSAKEESVRIALGIDPPFDRYIFIDSAPEHIEALEALRKMEAWWVEELRDICREQGVAFFFKQWGGVRKG